MGGRARGVVLGTALTLAGSLCAGPAGAIEGSPGLSAQSPAPLPDRISFVPPPGGSVLVHGTYPSGDSSCEAPVRPVLHSRHAGNLEVGRDESGRLFIVAVVAFEDYVRGIAEMPRSWPIEALKAQAVAARSYALSRSTRLDPLGERLGYDICATSACQVYQGLGVADGPFGARWRAAVDATAGQVLVSDGAPADTLYFSTSNGRTYGNDEVFGTPPVPYLRPVEEPDDGPSPLSGWSVRIPLTELARFLRAGGHWAEVPVATVRRSGPEVIVSGGGSSKTFDVEEFRDHLNTWAECLDPGAYPSPGDGGERLPQTIPSRWFSVAVDGTEAVLEGRGWGHGVGMVQWGAYGKAARGLAYDDILAAYYGGLRPQRHRAPDVIRIGLATGLISVTVDGTTGTSVEGATAGPGPWSITSAGALTVHAADPPPSAIEAGELDKTPMLVRAGRTLRVSLELPQLSVAQLIVRVGIDEVPLTPRSTYRAGTVTLEGIVPATLPSGVFPIQAVVTDGVDVVRTPAVDVRVIGAFSTSGGPSPGQVLPSGFIPAPEEPGAGATSSASPERDGPDAGAFLLFLLLGALAAAWAVSIARRTPVRRAPGPSPEAKMPPGSTPDEPEGGW